jgi:Tol biopolymer transport system component
MQHRTGITAVAILAALAACEAPVIGPAERGAPDRGAFDFAAAASPFSAWGSAASIDPGGSNNVNTVAMEGCPIESPNGRRLFFASNRAGGRGGIDIWVAHRDGPNDPWSDPENLPAPVNSAQDDFCPTPLPAGELLFVSRRPGSCGEGDSDIYRTQLHPSSGWSDPEHLGCDVNSEGDEFSPSYVPAGGGMLFFSSNRDGEHKIYMSLREAGGWGAPADVHELHVSGFNTLRPNVSADGREIVFDSDRPGGSGSFDVWTATRASVIDPWSDPVNPGANVNSASAETRASLSRDGTRLYFGSPRPGGRGSADIYVATPP